MAAAVWNPSHYLEGAIMLSKAEKDYALLLCMEFFRDELLWADPTVRQREKFTILRDLCDEALGHPSLADADCIRSKKVEVLAVTVAQESVTPNQPNRF